jgi:hypothetical protein
MFLRNAGSMAGMYNFGLRDEPRRMFESFRFGKHYSCHLQGECVLVGSFSKPHTEQAVGGEWDVMNMIGGAESGLLSSR